MKVKTQEVEIETVDEFTIENCTFIIKQPKNKPTEEDLNKLRETLVKVIYG